MMRIRSAVVVAALFGAIFACGGSDSAPANEVRAGFTGELPASVSQNPWIRILPGQWSYIGASRDTTIVLRLVIDEDDRDEAEAYRISHRNVNDRNEYFVFTFKWEDTECGLTCIDADPSGQKCDQLQPVPEGDACVIFEMGKSAGFVLIGSKLTWRDYAIVIDGDISEEQDAYRIELRWNLLFSGGRGTDILTRPK
ncbi:MAG: hypothetical protein V1723_00405 [Candidatus Uhrbacteria bacterium]